MMKNGLRGFAWFAGLALLVQGLAACSTSDSPMAPSSDDGAAVQRVNDNESDGSSGGAAPVDEPVVGVHQETTGGSPGKNPSTPDAGGDPTEG